MKTKSSYERLIRDMESGKIPPLSESGLLKKITRELEQEIEQREAQLNIPQDKMIVNILKIAQSAVEKQENKYKDDEGTLYSELCNDQKLAIIDDIINHSENSWQATKLIEMFVGERISIEKVERILFL